MSFISYSLRRAGWPEQMVNQAVELWMQENGRAQKTTDFKAWIKKYYRQARGGIAVVVVLDLIASAIQLLNPLPLMILADSVFGKIPAPGPLKPYTGKPELILIVALMTFIIFVAGSVFDVIKSYLILRISYRINKSIKEESFRHILHLPLYHDQRLTKGDYIYRQNVITNSLSDLVLGSTSEIIQSLLLVVGIFVIMFELNAGLTEISLVVIPFLVVSVKIFSPIMGKFGRAMTELASKMSSLITESIDNAEAVQAFSLEERQVQRMDDIWQDSYRVTNKGMLWSKLFDFTNSFLVVGGTSAVIYFGGSEALKQSFSLGELLVFMTYMGYFINPIQDITSQISMRRQKLMNVNRVYEVLTDHEGIEDVRQDRPMPRAVGRVEFQNVTYSYHGETLLNQLNLVIEPGEKVGIVGPSGSGKSTILKLLDLYLEPTAGRILIDNVDIQTVSLKDLRRNIAWISQTPELFAGTIEANLEDGDIARTMTREEIDWAAAAANLGEFVNRLPMGLESPLEEDGSNLSGGQRQRISIARALLKNAPVICMDEPTSALDMKSEKLILSSIGSLIQGKSVLLVTHRLPLLSLMDRVYALDGGRLINIEEFGGIDRYTLEMEKAGGL